MSAPLGYSPAPPDPAPRRTLGYSPSPTVSSAPVVVTSYTPVPAAELDGFHAEVVERYAVAARFGDA